AANANPGLDAVHFNIPGPAPHTISTTTELPAIVDPVLLDGTTEPGFAGAPTIELSGGGWSGAGFTLSSGTSTIRGIAINGFSFAQLHILTNGDNVIEGNFIGTDAAGTGIRPSAQ